MGMVQDLFMPTLRAILMITRLPRFDPWPRRSWRSIKIHEATRDKGLSKDLHQRQQQAQDKLFHIQRYFSDGQLKNPQKLGIPQQFLFPLVGGSLWTGRAWLWNEAMLGIGLDWFGTTVLEVFAWVFQGFPLGLKIRLWIAIGQMDAE